jgi:hypothetical protein
VVVLLSGGSLGREGAEILVPALDGDAGDPLALPPVAGDAFVAGGTAQLALAPVGSVLGGTGNAEVRPPVVGPVAVDVIHLARIGVSQAQYQAMHAVDGVRPQAGDGVAVVLSPQVPDDQLQIQAVNFGPVTQRQLHLHPGAIIVVAGDSRNPPGPRLVQPSTPFQPGGVRFLRSRKAAQVRGLAVDA